MQSSAFNCIPFEQAPEHSDFLPQIPNRYAQPLRYKDILPQVDFLVTRAIFKSNQIQLPQTMPMPSMVQYTGSRKPMHRQNSEHHHVVPGVPGYEPYHPSQTTSYFSLSHDRSKMRYI